MAWVLFLSLIFVSVVIIWALLWAMEKEGEKIARPSQKIKITIGCR